MQATKDIGYKNKHLRCTTDAMSWRVAEQRVEMASVEEGEVVEEGGKEGLNSYLKAGSTAGDKPSPFF